MSPGPGWRAQDGHALLGSWEAQSPHLAGCSFLAVAYSASLSQTTADSVQIQNSRGTAASPGNLTARVCNLGMAAEGQIQARER